MVTSGLQGIWGTIHDPEVRIAFSIGKHVGSFDAAYRLSETTTLFYLTRPLYLILTRAVQIVAKEPTVGITSRASHTWRRIPSPRRHRTLRMVFRTSWISRLKHPQADTFIPSRRGQLPSTTPVTLTPARGLFIPHDEAYASAKAALPHHHTLIRDVNSSAGAPCRWTSLSHPGTCT
jgi:hypothetical protein